MIASTSSSDTPNWTQLFFLSAIGSIATSIVVGFVLGINNNIFTLPIVGDLYDKPQFANDALIRSLRFYSAGPWILLSGAQKYIDAYWLYLILLLLSQLLAFLGFLACADLLGVRDTRQRLLLTALLCATPLLRGHSFAGDGGLFVNHFTHSEIANGLTLLLIYFLARGNLISAIAMNGLIFFDNAFVGVWCAGITLTIALVLLYQGSISLRKLVTGGLIGSIIAGIVSAPVVWDILQNPDFGKPVTFDYVAYLEEFWPYHFLFNEIGAVEKLDLFSLLILALASFSTLGSRGRLFLVATLGFAIIYTFGIVAPHLTHNPLILNLHLLRVGTALHLMAMLGALSLAVKWWHGENFIFANLFAPALIILLCIPIKMSSVQPFIVMILSSLIILASRSQDIYSKLSGWVPISRLHLRPVALALTLLGVVVVSSRNIISNFQATAWVNEWRSMATWARNNTDPTSAFLLPTWNFLGSPSGVKTPQENDAVLADGIFEFASDRMVWIDFRNGAAVLWSPSYYPLWHRRIAEVNALDTIESKIAYAKANGIHYVIEACESSRMSNTTYATARLCLYSAKP
jgi:hypothetical protein